MRKFVLVVALALAIPSAADDAPNRYETFGRGVPNFIMPSGGAYYGQIYNSASSSQWSLGFGQSKTANGTSVISWDSDKAVTFSGAVSASAGVTGPVTGNLTGNVTGNAATATALASDPSDAASGYVCRGVNASGTCQPALVEDAATNGSTNAVTSNALYDTAALKANLASSNFSGQVRHGGRFVLDKTHIGSASGGEGGLGIYISTVISVTTSYETLISSGLNLLMTATPAISTTTVSGGANLADGTYLVLTSTTAVGVITLQDQDQLAGSLLQLGAATRDITIKKTLVLMFDVETGYWNEISYGNN